MGGSSEPEIQQVDKLNEDQKQVLGALNAQIQPRLGGAFDRFFGTSSTDSPLFGQAEQAVAQFLNPQSSELAQEHFKKSIFDPSFQQFQEQVLPAVQERFAGVGAQRSSAMNNAMERATRGFQTDMQGQLANLLFSTEQNNLARQQQAIGQALGLAQVPFNERGAQLQSLLGASQIGLGTPAFDTMVTPGEEGPGGMLGSLAGAGAGLMLAGPLGLTAGGGAAAILGKMGAMGVGAGLGRGFGGMFR